MKINKTNLTLGRCSRSVLFLAVFLCSHSYAQDQPNILFILTDDQSCSSLSSFGGNAIETPSIDRLAESGMRFTDAYVMPQCSPTRAALLTGQHTAKNGMWHVIRWYGTPYAPVAEPPFREELAPEQCRLPRMLREVGYVTGMGGKWHLTNNPDQGYYSNLKKQAANEFGFDHVAAPGPGSQNEGDKWVDHLTEDAINFLRRNKGKPWFYYLSHHTLHGKVIAPQALIDKHLAAGAPKSGIGNAVYLAAIEHLDHSIDRLVNALVATGQRENTMVVFLADNGGVDTKYHHQQADGSPLDVENPLIVKEQQLENAPLREGKGSAYEGGIRVPCIVSWPNVIKRGSECIDPVHVIDWLPTFLDAANQKSPLREDGLSLLPLFRGNALPTRSLYWYMPLYDLRWAATPCAVIRSGDWKLIEFFGDRYDKEMRYRLGQHVELYNLKDDLSELRDLSTQETLRAKTMRDELRRWIKGTGAPIPSRNSWHDPERWLLETREKPKHIQPY